MTKEVMPDFLNPNGKGYVMWAEAMEPMIADLMEAEVKDEAKEAK